MKAELIEGLKLCIQEYKLAIQLLGGIAIPGVDANLGKDLRLLEKVLLYLNNE